MKDSFCSLDGADLRAFNVVDVSSFSTPTTSTSLVSWEVAEVADDLFWGVVFSLLALRVVVDVWDFFMSRYLLERRRRFYQEHHQKQQAKHPTQPFRNLIATSLVCPSRHAFTFAQTTTQTLGSADLGEARATSEYRRKLLDLSPLPIPSTPSTCRFGPRSSADSLSVEGNLLILSPGGHQYGIVKQENLQSLRIEDFPHVEIADEKEIGKYVTEPWSLMYIMREVSVKSDWWRSHIVHMKGSWFAVMTALRRGFEFVRNRGHLCIFNAETHESRVISDWTSSNLAYFSVSDLLVQTQGKKLEFWRMSNYDSGKNDQNCWHHGFDFLHHPLLNMKAVERCEFAPRLLVGACFGREDSRTELFDLETGKSIWHVETPNLHFPATLNAGTGDQNWLIMQGMQGSDCYKKFASSVLNFWDSRVGCHCPIAQTQFDELLIRGIWSSRGCFAGVSRQCVPTAYPPSCHIVDLRRPTTPCLSIPISGGTVMSMDRVCRMREFDVDVFDSSNGWIVSRPPFLVKYSLSGKEKEAVLFDNWYDMVKVHCFDSYTRFQVCSTFSNSTRVHHQVEDLETRLQFLADFLASREGDLVVRVSPRLMRVVVLSLCVS